MEELSNTFDKQLNTDLLLVGTLLATIVVSIKNNKKFKILNYFPIYTVSLLSGIIFNRISVVNHVRTELFPIATYWDYSVTLLELMIFSHFYYQLIKNHIVKSFIILSNLLFVPFFVFMAVIDKNLLNKGITESTQSIVYTVEGVILLILCLAYFFELFKKLPIVNLKNDPVFWISIGLLFFMACTLPYSLLENYFDKYYPSLSFMLYSLFYVFYVLLLIMIIRAYLCRAPISK